MTFYQDLWANEQGNYGESGFKIAYSILGMLKIGWTMWYITSHFLNILNEVSSWPLSCQFGQLLYLEQIALRAVSQIIKILSFYNIISSLTSEKYLKYINLTDEVLTSVQLTIFFLQP